MNVYDKVNVKNFVKNDRGEYICSFCGQYTTYDDSISNRGYNLVCNRCVDKMHSILNITSGNIIKFIHAKGIEIENEVLNEALHTNDL